MIEKIFDGPYLKRLDNIIQWQERDVFTAESVSTHSYKVTVFCRILLADTFGAKIPMTVLPFAMACLDHAMFHDWDEALLLRDISHETKYNAYNGDEIRAALDKLSMHLAEQEFLKPDNSGAGQMLYKGMEENDAAVRAFVKLCDWLALAFFLKRERSLGNENFEKQEKTVREGVAKSLDACNDVIINRFRLYMGNVNIFNDLKTKIKI